MPSDDRWGGAIGAEAGPVTGADALVARLFEADLGALDLLSIHRLFFRFYRLVV